MKYMTALDKMKKDNQLIHRDGVQCLYCGLSIPKEETVIDHLDNNNINNELWNLVRSHEKCNLEKRTNMDYQIKAKEKLDRNQARIYHSLEDTTERSNSPEIEHNTNCSQLTRQHLTERIKIHGKIEYKATSDCIAYHAMEKFGHSSQVSINRIIDLFCSEDGPFMTVKENGKRYITKRIGK